MKQLASIISYIFHPLFVCFYGLLLLTKANSFIFSFANSKGEVIFLLSVALLTLFFPILSILMMRQLGLISNFKMKERSDRIGPIIITSLFYLWLFINIKGNTSIPPAFSFLLLGATIGLFASLFLNSFTKISLHALGAGGFLGGLVLIKSRFTYHYIFVNLFNNTYSISIDLILILTIFLVGLICSSRLYLKAHNLNQIYGGLLVGVFSQIIAYRIII